MYLDQTQCDACRSPSDIGPVRKGEADQCLLDATMPVLGPRSTKLNAACTTGAPQPRQPTYLRGWAPLGSKKVSCSTTVS